MGSAESRRIKQILRCQMRGVQDMLLARYLAFAFAKLTWTMLKKSKA